MSRFQAVHLEHTAIDIGRLEQTNRWADALPYSLVSGHHLSYRGDRHTESWTAPKERRLIL